MNSEGTSKAAIKQKNGIQKYKDVTFKPHKPLQLKKADCQTTPPSKNVNVYSFFV